MTGIEAFEKYSDEYDEWFENNSLLYQLEIDAVKDLLPLNSQGLDIGAGSGKFSLPLGITVGIDPSFQMALKAKAKGLGIALAVAEALPIKDKAFDFALMVTSVCFVSDIKKTFDEAYRILRPGGCIITGFIDAGSDLGRKYQLKKESSRFYKEAVFYTTDQIVYYLKQAGFTDFKFNQTIFNSMEQQNQMFKKGHGEGSFVVVKADKPTE